MKKLIIAVALFFTTVSARADLINFSGDFDAFALGGSNNPRSFSGSWSATLDESLLTGARFQDFTLPTTSFSLSPNPLGATLFDTSNTGVDLSYFQGDLVEVVLGGIDTDTGPGGIRFGTDDFWVVYDTRDGRGGVASEVRWRVAFDRFGIDRSPGGSYVISTVTVPEPGTLTLFGIGLLGLGLARRKTA